MTAQPGPENTAARVALWRALHLQVDAPPHILQDDIGRQLLAPPEGWQKRGDMHPIGTRPFRASILARARFLEDLLEQRAADGVTQYVILGAGLDTFAQRRPELAARFFEPDEMLALARQAGFKQAEHVSAERLSQRYFAGRADGMRLPNNCEELLVAGT